MSVQQLPLALRYPPDQRLDSFIAAPAGSIAQLRALASAPGADWVYLSGASGSGKTHLALALCAATEQAGRRAAFLPLIAATGRMRDALEALEGHDVAVLDGLEAIAGLREDEVALFDFHNAARRPACSVAAHSANARCVLPLPLAPDKYTQSAPGADANARNWAMLPAGAAMKLSKRWSGG